MSGETLRRRIKRLVPGYLLPAPIAAHHGVGDPIGRMDKSGAEPALDAQHSETRPIRGDIISHQRESTIGANAKANAAADAAVGTGRLNLPRSGRGRFLWSEGPRRTGSDALPAGST